MRGWLYRYEEHTLFALRVVTGFWLVCHGLQKFGFLGGKLEPFGSAMNTAGLFEVPGGILVLLGLFTPYVAFIMSGQMAVAYYMYFQMFAPPGTVLPLNQGGEIASLLSFSLLYLAARGAGAYSVDGVMWRADARRHAGTPRR